MPGAEPFSAEGGPHGFLAVHGFTGTPSSMRPLAEHFAAAGWAVECPLLPGHGTSVEDMLETSWADWSTAAEEAYQRLAQRVEGRIVIGGLSMGGTLTVWLASRHPEVAGIVCINPLVASAGQLRDIVQAGVDMGQETMPGIGSDIAEPDTTELAYGETPLRPLLSLFDAVEDMQPDLASITVPVLLLTSPQDHVVPPFNSDHLAEVVAGPVERVTLERSYHVATLDYDRDLIEQQALDFAVKAGRDLAPTMHPMGAITRDDVAHVARLARLRLTEEELDLFTGQLAKVLDHARDVEALDVGDVPETAHPYPLRNVFRSDEPRPCLDRDEVLGQAPDAEDGRFKVPPILGEEP